jgi:hypothetical protein
MRRRDLGYVLFCLIRFAFTVYWCFQGKYDIAYAHIKLMEESHENFLTLCDKDQYNE